MMINDDKWICLEYSGILLTIILLLNSTKLLSFQLSFLYVYFIYIYICKIIQISNYMSYYVNIFEGFYQMDNLLTPLDLGCSEKATDKPPHRVTVGMIYPILWFIKWIVFWYLGIRCDSNSGIFMSCPFYKPPIEQQSE